MCILSGSSDEQLCRKEEVLLLNAYTNKVVFELPIHESCFICKIDSTTNLKELHISVSMSFFGNVICLHSLIN